MRAFFEPIGTIDGLREAIAAAQASGAKSVQVLGTVASGWTPELIDPLLTSIEVPVFGGLFPGLIFEGRTHERGTVVIGHDGAAKVAVLECESEVPDPEGWRPVLLGARTLFTYFCVSPLAGSVMAALFRELGVNTCWVGGGAGSLDLVCRPVVITPGGLRSRVVVVAGLEETATLGVTHGWHPIGEALLVTEAEGNDILTLEWRPAYEVYREVVEAHTGRRFDDTDFYTLASTYPLMLERIGGEGVVRDPLTALPGGGLRCAGDVQPYATIRVAHGRFEDLLAAAHAARAQVTAAAQEARGGAVLTIDCISRALLLGERLAQELEALRIPGRVQAGALTIGEVASSGDRFPQVHNKTTVLATLKPPGSPA
jgi:hypothetical protein